jgi:hypothetical protein
MEGVGVGGEGLGVRVEGFEGFGVVVWDEDFAWPHPSGMLYHESWGLKLGG